MVKKSVILNNYPLQTHNNMVYAILIGKIVAIIPIFI